MKKLLSVVMLVVFCASIAFADATLRLDVARVFADTAKVSSRSKPEVKRPPAPPSKRPDRNEPPRPPRPPKEPRPPKHHDDNDVGKVVAIIGIVSIIAAIANNNAQ